MKELDIRDIAIIDALPVYDGGEFTLVPVCNVGCGAGRLDWHLAKLGYKVYSTDYEQNPKFPEGLYWEYANIYEPSSFDLPNYPIVICSEVLEHLANWQMALKNLIAMASIRLIITVPYMHSFDNSAPAPEGHCNYWWDGWETHRGESIMEPVTGIVELCKPYATTVSKIRTKPEDVHMKQWDYLIVVDKRQHYG